MTTLAPLSSLCRSDALIIFSAQSFFCYDFFIIIKLPAIMLLSIELSDVLYL